MKLINSIALVLWFQQNISEQTSVYSQSNLENVCTDAKCTVHIYKLTFDYQSHGIARYLTIISKESHSFFRLYRDERTNEVVEDGCNQNYQQEDLSL